MTSHEQQPPAEQPKLSTSIFSYEKLQRGEGSDALPELFELKKFAEINAWHDHENVFDHTMSTVENMTRICTELPANLQSYLEQSVGNHSRKELLTIASLLHDIAKPDTLIQEGAKTSCPDHERLGAEKVPLILDRFDLTPEEITHIAAIVLGHALPHLIMKPGNPTRAEDLNTLRNIQPNIFIELLLQGMADTQGCHLKQKDPAAYQARIDAYTATLEQLAHELPPA